MLFQVNFAKKSRRNGGMLIVLSTCGQRETVRGHVLRQSPRCHQPTGWLLGGQRLSRQLVRGALGGAGSAQCLRRQIRQVEHCRFAHPTAEVAVSGVCQHQKTVQHPTKTHAPPRCGEHCEQLRCRVVRLGDSRERKKRPNLVKNQISKSLKELFK